MARFLMQAVDSVDGVLYTWTSDVRDWNADEYPGPNDAEDVCVLAFKDREGGGVGDWTTDFDLTSPPSLTNGSGNFVLGAGTMVESWRRTADSIDADWVLTMAADTNPGSSGLRLKLPREDGESMQVNTNKLAGETLVTLDVAIRDVSLNLDWCTTVKATPTTSNLHIDQDNVVKLFAYYAIIATSVNGGAAGFGGAGDLLTFRVRGLPVAPLVV